VLLDVEARDVAVGCVLFARSSVACSSTVGNETAPLCMLSFIRSECEYHLSNNKEHAECTRDDNMENVCTRTRILILNAAIATFTAALMMSCCRR
jgi:hypothetical protein